jgi:ubiquinone/menaquinone biosynthesis C-methylase UbiE
MKIRESGMPDEEQWDSFFEPKAILEQLGVSEKTKDVADFGAGYGTFTIPAAQLIRGKIYSLDIEPSMVKLVKTKAQELKLSNIVTILRDFISEGSDLNDSSVDFVMLFNILHLEKPTYLLKEAYRILKPSGKVGIIHWNYDPKTPRGPPMNIRPKPEQIRNWAESVGFVFEKQLDLKPYHYALVLTKKLPIQTVSGKY